MAHLTLLAVLALGMALTTPAFADSLRDELRLDSQKTTPVKPAKGGSPRVRSEMLIRGANVSIEYSRPSLKKRPDSEVMPPGKPWPVGHEMAAVLRSDKALLIGEVSVPAGTYTLFAIPGPPSWQLIVSKATDPAAPYSPAQDVGRARMNVATVPATEQLTITIDDTPGGGRMRLEWGTVRAGVPVVVAE
jgi:hypothetical protein